MIAVGTDLLVLGITIGIINKCHPSVNNVQGVLKNDYTNGREHYLKLEH